MQKDSYLLELSRYIVLNPVRASMTDNPVDYPWSSYCASIGQGVCPEWLAADNLLVTFDNQRKAATQLYQQYVRKGIDQPFSGKIMQQTYLGDESFIFQVQKHISRKQSDSIHITKRSKKSPKKPIEVCFNVF